MKGMHSIYIYFISILSLQACCKDEFSEPVALGEITVNLDASKSEVRLKEALIGNMICDAIKFDAESKGKVIDLAFMNGGDIRFNLESRPSGIYPSGFFTTAMIDEMLPFGNTNVVVKVTGTELKKIFERSVAQLPQTEGPFLQVSKGVRIIIDTSKTPQIINELVEPHVIVSEGNRIVSIKINNVECDSLKTYTVVTSNYLADGNDGYITLKNIGSDKKVNLEEDQSGAIKEYIILNTPISLSIEGRIVYQ